MWNALITFLRDEKGNKLINIPTPPKKKQNKKAAKRCPAISYKAMSATVEDSPEDSDLGNYDGIFYLIFNERMYHCPSYITVAVNPEVKENDIFGAAFI